jgi:hypothetical protein
LAKGSDHRKPFFSARKTVNKPKIFKVAATLAAGFAAVALATPAQAASYEVSGNSTQYRCWNAYPNSGGDDSACLYYGHDGSGGMYVTAGSVNSFSYANGNNPASEVFGSGAGEGQAVWNNATSIESEWSHQAAAYVNSNYGGDDDWVYAGYAGAFTSGLWNNEASLERW